MLASFAQINTMMYRIYMQHYNSSSKIYESTILQPTTGVQTQRSHLLPLHSSTPLMQQMCAQVSLDWDEEAAPAALLPSFGRDRERREDRVLVRVDDTTRVLSIMNAIVLVSKPGAR